MSTVQVNNLPEKAAPAAGDVLLIEDNEANDTRKILYENHRDAVNLHHEEKSNPHPQYETPSGAQDKVDAHANLVNNPHMVTKSQVGLGNVDNTSDMDKPVSTAQQAALDLKTDLTVFNTHASRHLPGGADPIALATTTLGGLMSHLDKVILNRLRTGFLQFTNANAQNNSTTTFEDVSLTADLDSFANGFFTKVSSTEFRADFTGRVKVHYDACIQEAGNNRGGMIRLQKNAVNVVGSERMTAGSSNTSASTTSPTIIIPVVSGDLIKMQFASTQGGQLSTIPINYAKVLIEIYSMGVS